MRESRGSRQTRLSLCPYSPNFPAYSPKCPETAFSEVASRGVSESKRVTLPLPPGAVARRKRARRHSMCWSASLDAFHRSAGVSRTTLEGIQPSRKSCYQVGVVGVGVKALQLVGVGVHVVELLLPVVPLYVGPLGRPEHVPAAAEVLHEDLLAPSGGPLTARREDRYQAPPV